MTEAIFNALLNYSKQVIRIAKEHVAANKVKIHWLHYNRVTCDELAVADDGEISPRMSSTSVIVKPWLVSEHEFAESVLKPTPDYQKVISSLMPASNPEGTAQKFFDYCCALCRLSLEPEVDDAELEFHVKQFGEILSGAPQLFKIVAHLDGVLLAEPQAEVAPGILLRQPTKADFSSEEMSGSNHYDSFVRTTAILEFTCQSDSPHNDQQSVYSLIDCLSLFALGAVRVSRERHVHRCSIMFKGGGNYPPRNFSFYKYSILSGDVASLKTFVANVHPLLKPFQSPQQNGLMAHPLRIALERYREATLRSSEAESRITQGISCLEALFLTSGQGELTHRLSQRVAALLKLVGLKPLEVYEHVKECYTIRSKFIHGEVHNNRTNVDAEAKLLLNYVRLCLVISLQLNSTLPKKQLFGAIDASMLDEQARTDLGGHLSELLLGK